MNNLFIDSLNQRLQRLTKMYNDAAGKNMIAPVVISYEVKDDIVEVKLSDGSILPTPLTELNKYEISNEHS